MTSVLVVGDGNFSYSLSLMRSLNGVTLITSSLESRIDDPETERNVQELSKAGVVVLHGVDGTRLESSTYLARSQPFDVIIFNFPHTGGKSNIKRNRDLLKGFFLSASQLLRKTGEIQVILCKGQGGTPEDCTERGYQNSWRLVEMAADAGLVLSKVEPFSNDSCPDYLPTGYRGGKKAFSLEGAMKHVLRFPSIDYSHWRKSVEGYQVCALCTEDSVKVTVPRELEDAMLYPLLAQPWHPLVRTKNALVHHFKCAFHLGGLECVDIPHLRVHLAPSQCVPRDLVAKLDGMNFHSNDWQTFFKTNDSCTSHPSTFTSVFHNTNAECTDSTYLQKSMHLHYSSAEFDIPNLVFLAANGVNAQLLCTPVVHDIGISLNPNEQLIGHELIIVVPTLGGIDTLVKARFIGVIKELLKQSSINMQDSVVSALFEWGEECTGIYVDKWKLLLAGNSTTVAKLGVYEANGLQYVTFCFYLEPLTMLCYGIHDVRLLTSKDSHFATQFMSIEQAPFISFCLYPPLYYHDISFWYTPRDISSRDILDQMLRSVIRQIVGNAIRQVTCIDTYKCTESLHTSYCFRLVYQHYDQPLCRMKSNALQLKIRAEFNRFPDISLR